MGFATEWLEKKALFPRFIDDTPAGHTGIIVVVPAYDEPEIKLLLDSLASCNDPGCGTEVLIIINSPSDAGKRAKENNIKCINDIESWKSENKSFFRLFYFNAGQPAIKEWGVGLARKTGMDEALRRFNSINRSDGVIASLDADCTVASDYFTALRDNLLLSAKTIGCSIYFEHPMSGSDFTPDAYSGIAQYELYMRYYLQALKYCGFPNAFHTVGSSMAVKALPYMKCGGMNRRQAGEDFYFVQKLLSSGAWLALNTTTVFPSPRESDRVPFGTGTVISRLLEAGEKEYVSYTADAFIELKYLFGSVEKLCFMVPEEVKLFYVALPAGLKSFMPEHEFISSLSEIRSNTATPGSFAKRFYNWFNMFMIIKYLNHVHATLFRKKPVTGEAVKLLSMAGQSQIPGDTMEILETYRKLERGINYSSGRFYDPPAE